MREPLRLRSQDLLLYDWSAGPWSTTPSVRLRVDGSGGVQFQRFSGAPGCADFGVLSLSDDDALVLLELVTSFGPLLKPPPMDDIDYSTISLWRAGEVVQSDLPLEHRAPLPAHLTSGAEILRALRERAWQEPGTRHTLKRAPA